MKKIKKPSSPLSKNQEETKTGYGNKKLEGPNRPST